jgi:hypothetical protein
LDHCAPSLKARQNSAARLATRVLHLSTFANLVADAFAQVRCRLPRSLDLPAIIFAAMAPSVFNFVAASNLIAVVYAALGAG